MSKSKLTFSPKNCAECGRLFTPRCGTQVYCDGPHTTICENCGKEIFYTCSPKEKPRYCSKECREEGKKKLLLEKYGVDNVSKIPEVQDKISQANLSEEVQKKRRETCLDKYGVDNPAKNEDVRKKMSEVMKSDEYLDKRRQTCIERYGTESPMQSDQVKQKINERNQEKYGVNWATQTEKWKESSKQTVMKRYGVPYYCMTDECKEKQGLQISSRNKQFAQYLNDLGFDTEFEFKLSRYAYDIHILDTNILIELDPTYTHNTIGNHWGEGLDKDYHLNKSKVAFENDYRCVHIFDWENESKIISMFMNNRSIYARKCTISKIDDKTASKFEKENHIQGSCKSQKICYGLYCDGELIEVMTFGKPRYNKKYQYELLRLCTKIGISVIGGASKLFKHFIKDVDPLSIISYCDRSKFDGKVYRRLGMMLDHTTAPAKIWSRDSEYVTNNFLIQRGYDQLFGTDYGKGTSNEELMIENGWLPVYDCGQYVYTWTNDASL